jgi:hypothetical protein
MANELDPIVDQWYFHRDKGQRFFVTAVEEDEQTVEVQHFDGDLEEYSFEQWHDMDIELSDEPENWTGALDIADRDDRGTEVTDTAEEDWSEPLEEVRIRREPRPDTEGAETVKSFESSSSIDISNVLPLADGEFQEKLSKDWTAEYSEDKLSGLWQVTVSKHDVVEWQDDDYASLQDAVQAAREYYNQV